MAEGGAAGRPSSALRRVLVPLALAQFICSFAGSNMNVMINDISADLDTTVQGVQIAITIFLLVFVFFLALAPTLQSGGHIEVDMFDALIPDSLRKPVRFIGKLLTVTFAAIFFWYVAAFYHDIVEVDEISFTMLIVQLKYIYWIGPVGAFQFLLTAIVLLVRFWREPLAADDEVATDAH